MSNQFDRSYTDADAVMHASIGVFAMSKKDKKEKKDKKHKTPEAPARLYVGLDPDEKKILCASGTLEGFIDAMGFSQPAHVYDLVDVREVKAPELVDPNSEQD